MLTAEGADDAEIIIRPAPDVGWRVEIPDDDGRLIVKTVLDQNQAFALAQRLRPGAHIRLLPGNEDTDNP